MASVDAVHNGFRLSLLKLTAILPFVGPFLNAPSTEYFGPGVVLLSYEGLREAKPNLMFAVVLVVDNLEMSPRPFWPGPELGLCPSRLFL